MNTLKADRSRQLHELRTRIDETSLAESNNKKAFEDEVQSSLTSILASDDSRRAAFQLVYEEEQQNVAVCAQFVLLKILHLFFLFFFLFIFIYAICFSCSIYFTVEIMLAVTSLCM